MLADLLEATSRPFGDKGELLKMSAGEVYQKILEYLKKDGPLNTFRLARNLDLDRSKLLNVIEKLEKTGAVEVQHGVVKFLKFVEEEKKIVQKPVPQPKKKKTVKKRKKHKKKPITSEVPAENLKLKEKILQLESKVEELEKKASAPPKIIKKTIVKEIPAPSVPTSKNPLPKERKVKKGPKKKEKKKKPKEAKKKSKTRRKRSFLVSQKPKVSVKFKLPKFTFMKNIRQLKKPEFAKK